MEKIRLMVLEPGHFHAALVEKEMYREVDTAVWVYAPEGPELEAYQSLIRKYNTRADHPTCWVEKIYKGSDYLDRLFSEKPGNIIVLAGKNGNKTATIKRSADAGLNILSDKPMAITPADFELLEQVFEETGKNKLNGKNKATGKNPLIYDIMTSRYEITNILEKELAGLKEVFGDLEKGTEENPAIIKQSTHHFYKSVSGAPLIRPAWYFDVDQEGHGLVDVTTHLVDLIQWECFPEKLLDYRKDVRMLSAREWPTSLTASQFRQVTQLESFPDFLQKKVKLDLLNVLANGEMNYTLQGIHARVSVNWNFQAPGRAGDTYYSLVKGTRASLVIRQAKEQQYKPVLYIEPVQPDGGNYELVLKETFGKLEKKYPGLSLKPNEKGWEVIIPVQFDLDHEQQFAKVTKTFLNYLQAGKMPDWEIAFMKTKYFTTTKALQLAMEKK
ncbi:putative oxidoreductase C-terminal domain-containing protein [Flavitalea flava]